MTDGFPNPSGVVKKIKNKLNKLKAGLNATKNSSYTNKTIILWCHLAHIFDLSKSICNCHKSSSHGPILIILRSLMECTINCKFIAKRCDDTSASYSGWLENLNVINKQLKKKVDSDEYIIELTTEQINNSTENKKILIDQMESVDSNGKLKLFFSGTIENKFKELEEEWVYNVLYTLMSHATHCNILELINRYITEGTPVKRHWYTLENGDLFLYLETTLKSLLIAEECFDIMHKQIASFPP